MQLQTFSLGYKMSMEWVEQNLLKQSLEALFNRFSNLNNSPDSDLKFANLELLLQMMEDIRGIYTRYQYNKNPSEWFCFDICEETIKKECRKLYSQEEVNILSTYIFPYIKTDNNLCQIDSKKIGTWTTSFLWDPKISRTIENAQITHTQTRYVFQSYGAPSLFKPSIGEVLSFAPKEANGFYHKELINCNFAMQSGFHLHSVVFFKLEE